MVTSLFVVLNLAAGVSTPALVEDVYTARESNGEYLYYAAADEEGGHSAIDPGKIDYSHANVNFEVSVNFERMIVDVAKEELERAAQGDGGALFRMVKDKLFPFAAQELVDRAGDGEGLLLVIESTPSDAMWIEAFDFQPGDMPATMQLEYRSVQDGRVLSISGLSRSEEYTVGELFAHWSTLLEQYRGLPMQRFEGARIE